MTLADLSLDQQRQGWYQLSAVSSEETKPMPPKSRQTPSPRTLSAEQPDANLQGAWCSSPGLEMCAPVLDKANAMMDSGASRRKRYLES